MAGTLATLLVKLQGDSSGLRKELSGVEGHATKTGGILKNALGTGAGFIGATVAMAGFGGALGLVKDGAIGMNAQLETSTLQFATLMGDSDKAKAHVESLFEFAAKTPFETGPIIEASRIMETFGGAALNSKENLKLFGDAAAATSAPINEVGFWMSRAYADIQAGRPFGEAAARLAELGIITPQTRNSLEDLQKSGASTDKVWGTLTDSLDRFDGAMEKQAGTFDGMVSTFMDGVNMLLARALRPLFDGLKVVLGGINDLMASPAFNGAVEAVGQGIAQTFQLIGRALGFVGDIIRPLLSAFGAIFDAFQSGGDVTEDVAYELFNLGDVITELATNITDTLVGAFTSLLEQVPGILDQLTTAFPPVLTAILDVIIAFVPQALQAFMGFISGMVNAFVENLPAILASVSAFFQAAFDWILNEGVPKAAAAIGPLALEFVEWVGEMLPKLVSALPMIAGAILNFLAANLPKLVAKLAEWGAAFIGWVAQNVLPKLPGALASIATALFTWLAGTAVHLIGEAGKMGAGFVKGVIDWVGKLPGEIAKIFGQIVSTVLGWAGQMGSAFGTVAIKAGKSFANGIVGLIEGAVNAVIKGINSFQIHFDGIDMGPLGKIAAIHWNGFQLGLVSLPRFETGAWDTGFKPFMGMIDPHEMILPAREAAAVRSFASGAPTSGSPADAFRNAPQVAQITVNLPNAQFYADDDSVARHLSELIGREIRLALKG